jgi:outer membrane protein assembly factor BamD (BamD/ComL family)
MTGKSQDSSSQEQWEKVKAVYNEGIYNYRAGKYDSAQESFSNILE